MTTSMFLPSHLSKSCPTNLSQTVLATPVVTKMFQCVPFRRVEGCERKLWLHISQQKLDMHFPCYQFGNCGVEQEGVSGWCAHFLSSI